ncbi:MAG: MFS transporter [Candidatus Azambacteria bacterium]|nr:MFS transporter [Candidatus Azambacteria bacterium]
MFIKFINKIIRVLVIGDVMFFSAFGLIGPIFAIFVTNQIAGATVATVGFATTINLLTRALLQMPVARYIDRHKGEKDDFKFMIAGSTLVSIVPFIYLFINTPMHLFMAQVVLGVGGALANPGWFAIFTRHIDKGKEGTEWTLENVSVGLAAAGTAAIGGVLAQNFGFQNLFLIVGVLSLLGLIIQISLYSTVIEMDHHHDGACNE